MTSLPQQQPQPLACGLANLGNTCYMNAILQALSHVPPFVRFVLQHPPNAAAAAPAPGAPNPHAEEDVAVYAAARRVLALAWAYAGQGRTVSPHELAAALGPPLARHGIANVREQSDAHELYHILADALCGGAPDRPGMAAMLCGTMQQLVRCETCGATSTQVTPFTTLDIDIAGAGAAEGAGTAGAEGAGAGAEGAGAPPQVAALLRSSLAPERIPDWTCDACRRGRTAASLTRIWSLPEVLVLCIKRAHGANPWDVCRQRVAINERLPKSLVARLAAPNSPAANGSNGSQCRFHLAAVVCHAGNQNGGHYTAVIKHPQTQSDAPHQQQQQQQQQWCVYDDEAVTPVDGLPQHTGSTCYMLLYSKLLEKA
jgi:uncharacterized UBP type Zn finger protein